MAVTWNPSDAETTVTLSNGNLDMVGGGNFSCVRATQGYSTGAWYFELNIVTLSGGGFSVEGIADNTTTLAGSSAALYPGNASLPNSVGFQSAFHSAAGSFVVDGIDTGFPTANGDICMFAVDVGNKKLWLGANGTWIGSVTPVVGASTQWAHWTGSLTVFPATATDSGGKTRLKALASSFSFSAPSGFSAWDPGSTVAFRRSLSPLGTRTGSRQSVGA